MEEIPKIEDLISPYAGEIRIGDKICKIRKPSLRKRIEFVKDVNKSEAGDDLTSGLERQIDIAVQIVEGADREDLLDLDFDQLNWIIAKSTGTAVTEPSEPIPKREKRKNA